MIVRKPVGLLQPSDLLVVRNADADIVELGVITYACTLQNLTDITILGEDGYYREMLDVAETCLVEVEALDPKLKPHPFFAALGQLVIAAVNALYEDAGIEPEPNTQFECEGDMVKFEDLDRWCWVMVYSDGFLECGAIDMRPEASYAS